MIEAKNIFKSYGSLQVLKGVNCIINQGEIVSIVGPSGAGKSTLLQIIGTLDQPNKKANGFDGEVLINGTNVLALSEKKLASFRNSTIGFVFQFHHLLPEFTALENVCIPGFIAKTKKAEVEKRAKYLLDLMGLSERIKHYPNELSGGEQQRVAVARSLINQPAVVMADEPSGNLDSESADSLHNLFFTLRQEFNQTFVIVTHNLELAKSTDKTLAMKDGVIVDAQ
ncbi:MAG: ABC transporter ATP-binding protein [Bacteroidetes bacterium]|nr:ABC transporter ATP-binding protein [Bacteroidota bacterium]